MRAIDADVLEKEGWSLHRDIRVDKNTWEYQTKPIRQVPTIDPRCETCEAFSKTRLLIPQPERRTGHWILVKGSNGKDYHKCSECLHTQEITGVKNYCPVCGAEMRGEQDG